MKLGKEISCGHQELFYEKKSLKPSLINTMTILHYQFQRYKVVYLISLCSDKHHDMMFVDLRLNICEIMAARKLSAKWLPCLLTIDHEEYWVNTSEECLVVFNRHPNFTPFHNQRRSVISPQHSGNQEAFETVGFSKRIRRKKTNS